MVSDGIVRSREGKKVPVDHRDCCYKAVRRWLLRLPLFENVEEFVEMFWYEEVRIPVICTGQL